MSALKVLNQNIMPPLSVATSEQSFPTSSTSSGGGEGKKSKLKKRKGDKKEKKKKKAKKCIDESDEEENADAKDSSVVNVDKKEEEKKAVIEIDVAEEEVEKMEVEEKVEKLVAAPVAAKPKPVDAPVAKPVPAAKPASEPAPPPPKKKLSMPEAILETLREACGPMNVKEIATKLRTTDTVLNNILGKMCDSSNGKKALVKKKLQGDGDNAKKTIYFANQKAAANQVTPPDEALFESTKQESGQLQSELLTLSSKTSKLLAVPKNSELDANISALESEISAMNKRIALCKAATADSQSASKKNKFGNLGKKKELPSDTRSLKLRINNMRAEWTKRKNKCMDFVGNCADGMEKKPKECAKLMQIETDEEVGSKMPEKYIVGEKKK